MQDKVILLTGGTGTFGNAFVKKVLELNPRQIRVFSRDELKQAQMKESINDPRVEYLLGDVRDTERLLTALEGVEICVHAAAMKRIEKCEKDPQEAVKTNILGTQNVANACLARNVDSAILISSDKAVYPINLYGATKLVAEKVWNQSNTYRGSNHPTRFSVVRYGNVLGSRGSLIQLWHDQSESGVIKVTDPQMTRYWLSIQQAVDLVCLAVEVQQGGEVFLPCLKSSPVMELARLVAGHAKIEYTGNRGGEKLHEVLATEDEFKRMDSFGNFSVINPFCPTWPYVKAEGTSEVKYHTSETADQYSEKELRRLVAEATTTHS